VLSLVDVSSRAALPLFFRPFCSLSRSLHSLLPTRSMEHTAAARIPRRRTTLRHTCRRHVPPNPPIPHTADRRMDARRMAPLRIAAHRPAMERGPRPTPASCPTAHPCPAPLFLVRSTVPAAHMAVRRVVHTLQET